MAPIAALTNYPISTEINTKGHMTIGGVDALELVEKFGSPLYVMDEQTLRHQCQMYVEALKKYPIQSEVIFASKSLSVLGVLQVIHQEGLGIDVVSGGELFTALKAGFSSSQIYFHGNNKTAAELSYALDSDIGYFIVDNISELELLDRLAKKKNVIAKILLRVTPGVEAHTHEYIQTGQLDSKFGIHADAVLNVVKLALTKKNISLEGLHVHIGSQILETKPYSLAAEIMMDLVAALQKKTGVEIKILNLGGGVGINYTQKDMAPEVAAFVDLLYKTLESRLDNVVFRMGIVATRPFARQVITHGHITVNGRRLNIPSYQVKVGDVIAVRKQSQGSGLFKDFAERLKQYHAPAWVIFDEGAKQGTVKASPQYGETEADINFGSILEFYSRV
jgi:diaminopimelate decarboxylase